MRFTRRRTLALGAFAGAALGLGLAARPGRGVASHALDVIREVFGPEFSSQEAAREFAQVYQAFVLEKGLSGRAVHLAYRFGLQGLPVLGTRMSRIDDSVIEKFATSTNVILAAERGEPLVFTGLFHPYETPCLNQLSADAFL